MKFLTNDEINAARLMVNKSQYQGDVSVRQEHYEIITLQAKAYNEVKLKLAFLDTRTSVMQDRIDRLTQALEGLIRESDSNNPGIKHPLRVLDDEKVFSHYDDKNPCAEIVLGVNDRTQVNK